MNVICMGGRTVGLAVAWDLVLTFLACEFSGPSATYAVWARSTPLNFSGVPTHEDVEATAARVSGIGFAR